MALDDRGYNANFRKISCKYPICSGLIKFLRISKQSQTTYVATDAVAAGADRRSRPAFVRSSGVCFGSLRPIDRIWVVDRKFLATKRPKRRGGYFRRGGPPARGSDSGAGCGLGQIV